MSIKKIKIKNFKIFKDFEFEFNSGLNILVGDNDVGKSTLIEALHLALTGHIHGKSIYNCLTEYLFNKECINEYLKSIKNKPLPEIVIEIFFTENICPKFMGHNNSDRDKDANGLIFKIFFDDQYKDEYEELIKNSDVSSLPIEYYDIQWINFADSSIRCKDNPIKSLLIDSSYSTFQNISDFYISHIVRDNLETNELVSISQAHRKMRDMFEEDESVANINSRLKNLPEISDKNIKISVELLTKNAWENSLQTCVDQIPFHHIGKGEQSIIKTKIALLGKKSEKAAIILIEEPENHLTYTRLNKLILDINGMCEGRQIFVSTHSSFVANKLGLENLVLLTKNNGKNAKIKLPELQDDTYSYFKKLPGYDTLRLILSNKSILVEGDSDELIVQKAYYQLEKKLPIQDNIDVISVGTSFLRFLEIAKILGIQVAVITDNDGKTESLESKYEKYKDVGNIFVSYDTENRTPENYDPGLNYNTLEHYLILANGKDKVEEILKLKKEDNNKLLKYMSKNKTECALRFFEYEQDFIIPEYIQNAIDHVRK